jgi:hypothetical protein
VRGENMEKGKEKDKELYAKCNKGLHGQCFPVHYVYAGGCVMFKKTYFFHLNTVYRTIKIYSHVYN